MFVIRVFNKNIQFWVLHIIFFALKIWIHLAQKAQLVLLIIRKVTLSVEYIDFAYIFLKKLAKVVPEKTSINKHAIKQKNSKQSPYGPI